MPKSWHAGLDICGQRDLNFGQNIRLLVRCKPRFFSFSYLIKIVHSHFKLEWRVSLRRALLYGYFSSRMALINISDAFFNLMRCKSYFLVLYVGVGTGKIFWKVGERKKSSCQRRRQGSQRRTRTRTSRGRGTRVQLSPGGNKKFPWQGDCGRSSANLLFPP